MYRTRVKKIILAAVFLMMLSIIPMMLGERIYANSNQAPAAISDFSQDMRLSQWHDFVVEDFFTDPEGDALTFYASEDEGSNWTQVTGQAYRYYPPTHGEYSLWFKAQDSAGNWSRVLKVEINVAAPPDEVTVSFSVTKGLNKFFVSDLSQKIMVPTELTVPYFDLNKYGLSRYYYNSRCYADHKESDTPYSSAQEAGTAETAEGVVTVMHVFIYATEVLYLGYDKADAGTGLSYEEGDFGEAISWTQGAGSSFMSMWNQGTNLNYYLNYAYPLGAPAWGSTSDQQPLYGGESIAVHFLEGDGQGSDFPFFTADGSEDVSSQIDELSVKQGTPVTLSAFTTKPDWNTYITSYVPFTQTDVTGCREDNLSEDVRDWEMNLGKLNDEGRATIDTSMLDPGTYYIAAKGKVDSESKTESGPIAVRLTVLEPGPVHVHEYGTAEYVWSDDNSEVTATAVCIDSECDGSDGKTITETAETTSEVTEPETCEKAALITYTAEFENSLFKKQTKTAASGETPSHDYGAPSYTWASDYSKVTAKCVCSRNDAHVKEETVTTASEVTKKATCEEKGQTTYTAEFEDPAFEKQTRTIENIKMLGHDWDSGKVTKKATCTAEGTKTYTCQNDPSHTYSNAIPATGHSMNETAKKPATYKAAGNSAYWYCSKCEKYFSDKAGTKEIKKGSWVLPKLKSLAQKVTVKRKAKTVKVSTLKTKAVTVKPLTVKGSKGKLSYKVAGGSAKSKKVLKLNAKTGKVTVTKKTGKGKYVIKVKVTAAATADGKYKLFTKTVNVTVNVK